MKLLITLSQNGFEWAWKTSIYATLLIVLVFLLQKLLAKWLTPRLRYALSLLVLIRLWLPIVPSSSLSFENLFPQSARLMQPAAVLPISGLPLEEVISVHQSVISPVSAPAVDHPRGIFASGAIGLGWAAGCLCLLSLAGWRYWKWNRLIKLGRPISDPKLIDLLNSAGEAMRVRSAVTLVAVSQLGSPAVFGFRRVRLLLPEAVLRQLNDQELRLIFLHEMAHVRRKDVLLNFLLITVQFLHWFNPFVWLALHRLRADRELVCDAMVMQRVGPEERPGYGKVLLKLMDGFSVGHRVFASAVPVVGSKHEIKRRIIMIKHHRRSSIAACVATALMVTALGCATFTRAGGEKQQGKLIENPPSVAQHPTQENTTVLAKKGPSGGLVGKEPT